ncbi:MAG: Phosphoribosylformylglycinamidine synthase, PurS subunit, partial [uncultured Gemmatimonadaceae bacterium]
ERVSRCRPHHPPPRAARPPGDGGRGRPPQPRLRGRARRARRPPRRDLHRRGHRRRRGPLGARDVRAAPGQPGHGGLRDRGRGGGV